MKQTVRTDSAPAPVGPYCQAVAWDRLVFTSGQIGLDPQTGQMVSGGVAAEAEQVFANLAAVLKAAGSGLDRALKVTVFLVDMKDFGPVNEVYARHFAEPYPARSCFAVAGLPKSARVEVELVAER